MKGRVGAIGSEPSGRRGPGSWGWCNNHGGSEGSVGGKEKRLVREKEITDFVAEGIPETKGGQK